MTPTRSFGAAILSALLLLGACGGETPSTETEASKADSVSQEDEAEDSASNNIDTYFELIGENSEDSLKEAASIAAPDSVANAYATHLMYLAATDVAAGYPVESNPLPKKDGGFELCDLNGDGDPSDCALYTDFETSKGKIASFSADGKSIDGRVVVGEGEPTAAGDLATVRFVSAYQSPFTNTLFINIEVKTSGQAVETGVGSADYRRPDGRQVTSAGYEGDYQVGADSTVTNYVIFPGSDIGGEVSFEVNNSDYSQTAQVTLKTG